MRPISEWRNLSLLGNWDDFCEQSETPRTKNAAFLGPIFRPGGCGHSSGSTFLSNRERVQVVEVVFVVVVEVASAPESSWPRLVCLRGPCGQNVLLPDDDHPVRLFHHAAAAVRLSLLQPPSAPAGAPLWEQLLRPHAQHCAQRTQRTRRTAQHPEKQVRRD